jgi:urease beta subunit
MQLVSRQILTRQSKAMQVAYMEHLMNVNSIRAFDRKKGETVRKSNAF